MLRSFDHQYQRVALEKGRHLQLGERFGEDKTLDQMTGVCAHPCAYLARGAAR